MEGPKSKNDQSEVPEYRALKYHIGALYKYTLGKVIEMRKYHDYKVEFTACGRPMELNIILGNQYPLLRPTIFLNPRPDHAWMHPLTSQVVYAPGLKAFRYWERGSNYFVLYQIVEEIIMEMKQHFLRHISLKEAVTTDDLCHLQIYSSSLEYYNSYTIREMKDAFKKNGVFKRVATVPIEKFDEYIQRVKVVNRKLDRMAVSGKLKGLKEAVINSLLDQMQHRLDEDINCRSHFVNLMELENLYDELKIRQYLHEAVIRNNPDYNMIAKAFLNNEVTVEMFSGIFRILRAARIKAKPLNNTLYFRLPCGMH